MLVGIVLEAVTSLLREPDLVDPLDRLINSVFDNAGSSGSTWFVLTEYACFNSDRDFCDCKLMPSN